MSLEDKNVGINWKGKQGQPKERILYHEIHVGRKTSRDNSQTALNISCEERHPIYQ